MPGGREPRARWTPLTKADAAFGPVCPLCGGRKAKQAAKCQGCRTLEKRTSGMTRAEYNHWYWRTRLGYRTPAPVGAYTPAHARRSALEAARDACTGELAELVAAQADDERNGHRAREPWLVSLDATDAFGRPRYEVIAA